MALADWKRRAAELEREVYALYLAFRDDRTPLPAKAVIAVLVAYVVSPVDPIPDVIPGIGYLDELLVVPVGVRIALSLVPERVMADCRARAGEELAVGRVRWVVAGVVVLVWAALGVLAVRALTARL